MNLTYGKTLRNGVEIPLCGFGIFKIPQGEETVNAVKEAIKVGYRHIDAAAVYGNEESLGQALRECNIAREEIFICDKVWNSDQGYEATLKAFDLSLKKLGLDYIDLYLIHWPRPNSTTQWKELNRETWRAMEKLYKEGKIKALGTANFHQDHLEALMETAEVMPMVNQIECHPQLQQNELIDFCNANNIVVEAWGPLMQGQIFEVDLFKELAEKYNKTIAQIVLRWHLQRDIVAIPKSTNPERIKANTEIFDFELSKEDMERIAEFNKEERIGPHPDHINF